MYARDHALIATPIGPIEIDGDEQSISHTPLAAPGSIRLGRTAALAEQIDAYFSNNLNVFCIISLRGELIALRYGEMAAGQRCVRNPSRLPSASLSRCRRGIEFRYGGQGFRHRAMAARS